MEDLVLVQPQELASWGSPPTREGLRDAVLYPNPASFGVHLVSIYFKTKIMFSVLDWLVGFKHAFNRFVGLWVGYNLGVVWFGLMLHAFH